MIQRYLITNFRNYLVLYENSVIGQNGGEYSNLWQLHFALQQISE